MPTGQTGRTLVGGVFVGGVAVSDVGSVFPTEGSEYFLWTGGWALVAPITSSMTPS
jgi:hypothetical protein